MSQAIANDLVVSIHYRLTNEAGELLDTSEGSEPLKYLHGAGNILPALENALTGKQVGDSIEVTIQPEDAYGEVLEDLVQQVPREMFQGVDEIQVGMMFQTQTPDGQMQVVTVSAVDADTVTIDANHPLAGKVVTYHAQVESVREASDEEKSHGHVHD